MPPIVVHVHDDVRSANDVFVRAVSALSDAQLRAPSRLPNWTRGHVAAHVALNAEGFVEVASALRSGQRAFMYPSGLAERDQAIDDLALASSEELTARVRDAGLAFMEAWDPLPPIGDCATAPGYPTFSPSTVLQRRLRELQVHLVDLALHDFGVECWSASFVDSDLGLQWATVEARTNQPVAAVDEFGVLWRAGRVLHEHEPVHVSRRLLLAWVLDRGQIEGLPLLQPWSNRSKWEHLPTTA